MNRTLLTLVLLACSAVWLHAQNSAPPEPALGTGSSDAEPASNNPNTPWLPVGINGETGPLAFSSETEKTNLLTGGVTVNSNYDDNALSNSTNQIGNLGLHIAPTLAIKETRPRTVWSLNYNPGFTFNQRLQPRNDYAHNLEFNFQYRLSEQLTLRLRNNFADQTSVYDQLNTNRFTQSGNPLTQPNPSLVTPLARIMRNLTDLDLVYQLGEGSVAGVSGSFNRFRYQDEAGGLNTGLVDTNFGSASAFYSHRLWGSHWLGVNYAFQRILSTGPFTEASNIQTAQLAYTYAPKSNLSLSLFAGPDHTVTNDQITVVILGFRLPLSATHAHWTAAGGATFGWQGQRTSVQASLVRHVTDGGGLTGGVRSYVGNVEARRKLTGNLTANVGLIYGANDPLGQFNTSAIHSLSALGGVERRLGEHFSVQLGYARVHQNYKVTSTLAPRGLADHDRGWISFSYSFTRPLGR